MKNELYYQMIYFSTAIIGLTIEDVEEIVRISSRNNAKRGVTGLLLFHEGRFLQILEGAEEVVDQLFEKIEEDERHTQIDVILTLQSRTRLFSQWSMGLKHLSVEDINQLDTEFTTSGIKSKFANTPHVFLEMIASFVANSEQ